MWVKSGKLGHQLKWTAIRLECHSSLNFNCQSLIIHSNCCHNSTWCVSTDLIGLRLLRWVGQFLMWTLVGKTKPCVRWCEILLFYNKVDKVLRNEWTNESNVSLILHWFPVSEEHGYSYIINMFFTSKTPFSCCPILAECGRQNEKTF